jgi:hypothetical protein
MDTKKLQEFKLLNLLKSVISLIDVYEEKQILENQISFQEYESLKKVINEFISKHLEK